jgi:hypothetical protein
MICAFFITLTGLHLYSELGYSISWDNDRVYMRPHGVKWNLARFSQTSIRYDAITSSESEFGAVQALQRRFMPFDHVRLYGETEGPEPFLTISPNFLSLAGARDVLRVIDNRRPNVLPREVMEFINSDKPW